VGVLAAALASSGIAAAQPPPGPPPAAPPEAEPASEPTSLRELGFKGQLLYKNFSHFDTTPNDHHTFRNEGILDLEWSRRVVPWADLKLVLEVRGDDNGFADGVRLQIPETDPHRSVLSLKEATVKLRGGPVEVTLGKQVFAWGTADAYNPTDNLSPYDYMDVLDNEKIGVYAAAGRFDLGPASLTLVVIPFFTPSRLPLLTSRWTPPLPEDLAVVLDDRQLPGRDLDNMQYAGRLRGTLGGWDLSVSYFDGFDTSPTLRVSTAGTADGGVVPRVTPVFPRTRFAGFDFSTTVRQLEVHGESAFVFADRDADDRFQAIAGINYTWDSIGLSWLDQITLVLEYVRAVTLRSREPPAVAESGLLASRTFRSGFNNAGVARLHLKLSEDTFLKLTGIGDFSQAFNYYAQIKLTHRFSDAFHLEGGLDFLAGPADTFWGRWRDNDRFFLLLKYLF
jgi:hypothetical protein